MEQKRQITDQMGREISVPISPSRIISLVPSQTELLFYLGLDEEVVGITKFCIHPSEQFQKKVRVGGTKQLKFAIIEDLRPDLIIANKEENDKAQIERLAEKYPVWISDIYHLEDALNMIQDIGHLVNRPKEAQALASNIVKQFHTIPQPKNRLKAAYFIWRKPWMVAGSNTFIHHMLARAGFENAFGKLSRYPELTLDELALAEPELILLSSEPYPFKAKHIEELQEVCPRAVIKLVDGELFSWYGNRLLHSAGYFRNLQLELIEK